MVCLKSDVISLEHGARSGENNDHLNPVCDNQASKDVPSTMLRTASHPPTDDSDLTEYVANELNQYSQIDDGSTLEPTHDADGNLTFDGQFNYSWNGENRLVQVTSAVVTEGAKRLTFGYDHQGRRFQKRVEEYQSGAWTEVELTRFLYDDWNLIAE